MPSLLFSRSHVSKKNHKKLKRFLYPPCTVKSSNKTFVTAEGKLFFLPWRQKVSVHHSVSYVCVTKKLIKLINYKNWLLNYLSDYSNKQSADELHKYENSDCHSGEYHDYTFLDMTPYTSAVGCQGFEKPCRLCLQGGKRISRGSGWCNYLKQKPTW
jgi:hypothetical protein